VNMGGCSRGVVGTQLLPITTKNVWLVGLDTKKLWANIFDLYIVLFL